MNSKSKKYVATTTESANLKIYYLNEELTIFYEKQFSEPIKALFCTDEFLLFGKSNELFLLNYCDLKEHLVSKFKTRVTSVFSEGKVVYCASECGIIRILGVSGFNKQNMFDVVEDSLMNSLACIYSEHTEENIESSALTEDTGILVKFVSEMKHTAPILDIATDGINLYCLDVKGRVTMFPSKISYDYFSSCIKFKNYLFVAEKNFLYCKTKEAFAVWIKCDHRIVDFTFSTSGSVVFIHSEGRLAIYDFNEKRILNELSDNFSNFVFDEERNRILVFEDRNVRFLKNVLDSSVLLLKMKNVEFKKNNIVEKVIGDKKSSFNNIKELCDDEDELNLFSEDTRSVVDRRKNKYALLEDSEQEDLNLFDEDDEVERVSSENRVIKSISVKSFMSGSLKSKNVNLLTWNELGFMISRENDDYNYVEIIYHNRSIQSRKLRDNFKCSIGCFSENYVVLSDGRNLYFVEKFDDYEENIQLNQKSIESEDSVILLTTYGNMMGVVYKTSYNCILRIYLKDIEVFNCGLNENVITICSGEGKIAVFYIADSLKCMLIKLEDGIFKKSTIDLFGNINFCGIENNNVFFSVNDNLYFLYENNLPVKVCGLKGRPLSVINDHVVCINENSNLLPEPKVEYYKLSVKSNFKQNIEIVNDVVFKREEGIIKAIKSCYLKQEYDIVNELYKLLTDQENRKNWQSLIGESRIQEREVEEDEFPVHFRSLENNETFNENLMSDSPSKKVKTKRFNPFGSN